MNKEIRTFVITADNEKLVYCNACGHLIPEQNVYYGKTLTICDDCIEQPAVEGELLADGDPNENEEDETK